MGTAVCSARQQIGKSRLPGAQPLVLRRLRAFVFKVLDRERVAALQHLDAGAALLGDRLPVLAGTDAQRDHPPPQRRWRRGDEGIRQESVNRRPPGRSGSTLSVPASSAP